MLLCVGSPKLTAAWCTDRASPRNLFYQVALEAYRHQWPSVCSKWRGPACTWICVSETSSRKSKGSLGCNRLQHFGVHGLVRTWVLGKDLWITAEFGFEGCLGHLSQWKQSFSRAILEELCIVALLLMMMWRLPRSWHSGKLKQVVLLVVSHCRMDVRRVPFYSSICSGNYRRALYLIWTRGSFVKKLRHFVTICSRLLWEWWRFETCICIKIFGCSRLREVASDGALKRGAMAGHDIVWGRSIV